MRKLFTQITSFTGTLPEREEGQGLVEYAVVLGVLVVGLIGVWNASGIQGGVTTALGAITGALTPGS